MCHSSTRVGPVSSSRFAEYHAAIEADEDEHDLVLTPRKDAYGWVQENDKLRAGRLWLGIGCLAVGTVIGAVGRELGEMVSRVMGV